MARPEEVRFQQVHATAMHRSQQAQRELGTLDVHRVRQAIEEHQVILAAIRSGDPDAAEAAARSHIATTIRTLEADRAAGTVPPPA